MTQRTLELLDELTSTWGMTDTLFQRLHHFGSKASIAQHRKFCREQPEFKAGSVNDKLEKRLALVLERLKTGTPWAQAIKNTPR